MKAKVTRENILEDELKDLKKTLAFYMEANFKYSDIVARLERDNAKLTNQNTDLGVANQKMHKELSEIHAVIKRAGFSNY